MPVGEKTKRVSQTQATSGIGGRTLFEGARCDGEGVQEGTKRNIRSYLVVVKKAANLGVVGAVSFSSEWIGGAVLFRCTGITSVTRRFHR